MNRRAILLALALASPAAADEGPAKPGTLPLEEVRKALDAPGAHEAFVPKAPLGITADLKALISADNPCTPAKVELGRQLYFDPRLSKDSTVSCATCHHPAKGWTDRSPVSTGIGGQKGGRSAPTVMNRALAPVQFWDGRAPSLEAQALGPIGNPIEMGFSPEEAAKRLNEIPGYKIQFEKVFGGSTGLTAGGPATPDAIAKSIAAFERTILAGASPNDYFEIAERWRKAEADTNESADDKARRGKAVADEKARPMGDAAKRGRVLFFGKAQCATCHVGQNFADELYYNLGVGADDPGREKVTGRAEDHGAFRTMTLRNIAQTAPYMHDGSQKTLLEVVEHYDKGGNPNPNLSKRIVKLGLTKQEKEDLVKFLEEGLTGEVTKVETPRLP